MPFIKFSQSERRRLSLFFICLVLAIGAWLFFALSNRYNYQARTVLRYVHFPENKAFHPLQSDTVTLQIEGTGWQLLFSRLRISPESIDVDLKDLSKQTFINLSDQLGYINRQFSSTQKIVYIQPDTLYFDFSSRVVKKVPIVLLHDLQFLKQYGISDSIKINPAYVTITGPVEDLRSITVWKTDTLKLKNVSGDISQKVAMKQPLKANINIYPSLADIKIRVEEFTEKTVEVPIKILNNHNYNDIKLLPDKVRITMMVSLGEYALIDRDFFEVSVDLDKWANQSYKQLPVKLDRFPEFCKLIRIEPQNVDFIIQR